MPDVSSLTYSYDDKYYVRSSTTKCKQQVDLFQWNQSILLETNDYFKSKRGHITSFQNRIVTSFKIKPIFDTNMWGNHKVFQ